MWKTQQPVIVNDVTVETRFPGSLGSSLKTACSRLYCAPHYGARPSRRYGVWRPAAAPVCNSDVAFMHRWRNRLPLPSTMSCDESARSIQIALNANAIGCVSCWK